MADLQTLLMTVGAHGAIQNPYQAMTKGEMFARVADRIGKQSASEYLSATNSCSHTDGRYSGAQPGFSCGVCFGCIVRRAAFMAAGIRDLTEYLSDDQAGRFSDFVAGKSIVEAVRDFAANDPKMSMVFQMSLPPNYRGEDALDLCRRGIHELRAYLQ